MNKKDKIVDNLRKEHDKVVKARSKNPCYQRAYLNLPINLLERTFLEMYARSVHSDQTKTIRKFIHGLMDENPNLVKSAEKRIKKEQRNK